VHIRDIAVLETIVGGKSVFTKATKMPSTGQ
jgi:hypothetical protein